MKSVNLLAVLAALLFCSTANAEFFIDNFTIFDEVGGSATSIGSNGITVSVTESVAGSGAASVDAPGNRYLFQTEDIGDSFTIAYDFPGTFDDLQSISGLFLTEIPVSFFGNWTLSVDTGVGTPTDFGPTIPTILPSPIALDDATELSFTFTFLGGGLPGIGGLGAFGGPSNPLFATPEPTAFTMAGLAGLLICSRRRRRS